MRAELFRSLLDQIHVDLVKLTESKGREYAASVDQLANFKRQGVALDLAPEMVLMVYLSKHMDTIREYCKGRADGRLSEPIESRILDAILYLCLLLAFVREETDPLCY